MPAMTKQDDGNPLGALWTTLVIALLASVIGFYHYRKAATFSNKGVQADGQVVGVGSRIGSKGRRFRTVHIQFTDALGKLHKFSVDHDSLDTGDHAPVVYVSDDPKVADLAGSSNASTTVSWIIIGVAAVAWAGLGLQLHHMGKKPKRSRPKR